MLTQKRVKELFDYNPFTGELRWRIFVGGNSKVGGLVGSQNPQGYYRTELSGKKYLNHRLIWLYVYGYIPENPIDHINRNPSDNRLKNLRETSPSCNMRNASQLSSNTSGVKGVGWQKDKQRWAARIKVDKKSKNLGYFLCFLEAACHRLAAEQCLDWNDHDAKSSAFKYVRKELRLIKKKRSKKD